MALEVQRLVGIEPDGEAGRVRKGDHNLLVHQVHGDEALSMLTESSISPSDTNPHVGGTPGVGEDCRLQPSRASSRALT